MEPVGDSVETVPEAISPQPAAAAVAMTGRPGGNLAWNTVLYLMRTEVHTFAFSVAANALLSFFPFVLLLLTLTRHVFHSPAMYDVVLGLLRDNVPAGQDFVVRNFNAMAGARHRVQVLSLVILLFTSTGVFVPLEVALNQVGGFRGTQPYWRNQLVSFALAFGCGVLALLSVALTAENIRALQFLLHGHAEFFVRWFGYGVMKGFAIAASVGVFFLIYWALPNGKGATARRSSGRGHHWVMFGNSEVFVFAGVALAEFPAKSMGRLRSPSAWFSGLF